MSDEVAETAPVDSPATEASQPADVAAPASDTETKPETAEADASATPDVSDVDDLSALSKEERRRYAAELAKLDPAARKTFNSLLTQKSQAAAAERKRLAAWAEVADAWERDPSATLERLQQALPKKEPAGPAPVDPEVLAAVSAQLDDASKPLAPILAPVVAALLRNELTPVRQFMQERQQEAQMAQAQTVLAEFEKERPDWKSYEAEMVEWGKKVPVGEGMTQREYLEVLYRLSSGDKKVAAAEKARATEVLDKVRKSAANAEPDTPSVSPASVNVRKAPTTVEEAYALAKQGIEVQL